MGLSSTVRRGIAALALAGASYAQAQTPALEERVFGDSTAVVVQEQQKPHVQSFSDLPYPTNHGNLEYFGFTGACPDAQTLRATKPYMNLCTIGVEDARWSDRQWTAEMMKNDMHAILMSHNAFYERVGPGNGTTTGAEYDLLDGYADRWRSLIAGKEANIATLVKYIYLADEPNWLDIDRFELLAAHDVAKASFPFIPTLTSLNHKITAAWFGGHDIVTDTVGYHRYGVDEPHNDPEFVTDIALIKSYSQGKKRVYVMDAWIPHGTGSIEYWEPRMIRRAKNYYAIAAADPDARALVGFHWPSWVEGIGASGMTANTRQMYRRIGSAITGKCLAPSSVDADKALFFQDCEFYATVDYRNVHNGNTPGKGYAKSSSDEFGQFTFFSDTNVELGMKMFHFPSLGFYGVYISGYTDLPLDVQIYRRLSPGSNAYTPSPVETYSFNGGSVPPGAIFTIDD